MVSTRVLNSALTFVYLVGLGLSIYAYTIELSLKHNPNYKAMCDIGEHMSCTKAFKSEYGKGFGLFSKGSVFHQPNSLLGISYYSAMATLAQSNSKFITTISFLLVILSNISSVYFAYLLYFKLYDFCVVCVSIYVVNLLSLLIVKKKLHTINVQAVSEKKKKAN